MRLDSGCVLFAEFVSVRGVVMRRLFNWWIIKKKRVNAANETPPPSGPSNMVDFSYAENARNFRIFLMR